MFYYLCIVAILLALLAGMLMLRLRIRLEYADDKRLLFAGLGRTGSEFDFVAHRGVVRLFGWTVKRFDMEMRFGDVLQSAEARLATDTVQRAGEEGAEATERTADVRGWLEILPQCLRAGGRYLLGLLRGVSVEQAEGEIVGGFDEPDVTGQVFGWYQAALAAAPGVVGRVRYTPVWTEASFSASLRLSVALPLYHLVWQTILLAWRLPLRKIIRLMR